MITWGSTTPQPGEDYRMLTNLNIQPVNNVREKEEPPRSIMLTILWRLKMAAILLIRGTSNLSASPAIQSRQLRKDEHAVNLKKNSVAVVVHADWVEDAEGNLTCDEESMRYSVFAGSDLIDLEDDVLLSIVSFTPVIASARLFAVSTRKFEHILKCRVFDDLMKGIGEVYSEYVPDDVV